MEFSTLISFFNHILDHIFDWNFDLILFSIRILTWHEILFLPWFAIVFFERSLDYIFVRIMNLIFDEILVKFYSDFESDLWFVLMPNYDSNFYYDFVLNFNLKLSWFWFDITDFDNFNWNFNLIFGKILTWFYNWFLTLFWFSR